MNYQIVITLLVVAFANACMAVVLARSSNPSLVYTGIENHHLFGRQRHLTGAYRS